MTTAAADNPQQKRPKFDSLEQQAYLSLWRTYDRLKALEDDLFGPHGISAQQYNVLRLLEAAQPQGMPTLALGARLISRAPDITRLIDRLEARGLVGRTRVAGNRRVVQVCITAGGLALVESLADAVRERHVRQLGHLSRRKLRELIALLDEAREPHEPQDRPW